MAVNPELLTKDPVQRIGKRRSSLLCHPGRPAIWLSAVVVLLFATLLWGQEEPASLTSSRHQLSKIRGEIDQLNKDLARSKNKLQSELENFKTFDQQISLQKQALRILQGDIEKNRLKIVTYNVQIDTLEKQIATLQDIFSKQIAFSYKFQRGKEFEWLLGSNNFNQALIRYRYFQTISESAQRLFLRLRNKQAQLSSARTNLQTEMSAQELLAREKATEQQQLLVKFRNRKEVIDKIKGNNILLEKSIREKRRSYEKLDNYIENLERQREQRVVERPSQDQWAKIKGDFSAQRRKLNWPVNGKIAHAFGKNQNPKLKTVLVNNGIDIQAEKGMHVRSVFSGVVSVITYMSGFGNTVIVDHNNGFYTVYAHMDEVFVKKFQLLDAGTVIGTVGDSGSLEGAMLHFEIYGGNQPLNPAAWLKRN